MSRNLLIIVLCCAAFFLGKTAMHAHDNQTKQTNTLIQPPYLQAGDTVAIVAPSGILKNRTQEIERAKALLKDWGLHVVMGAHVFSQNFHFAGTDAQRCEDFQKALDDPTISAIWCARGGYGSVRILDKLDYTKFKKKPKWIIGYSDITAFHCQLNTLGVESLHAMMCTSLEGDTEALKETIASFKEALFGKPLNYTLEGSSYNQPGEVTAPLVGGNLSILASMLGSKTSIDTTGKILFIEEIGEYRYSIDRMLQSLKRAGYFDHCKGVLVGDITKVRKNTTYWGSSTEQLILDALSEYDFPIAFNMPAGHEIDNRALILGRTIHLTVNKDASSLVFENN